MTRNLLVLAAAGAFAATTAFAASQADTDGDGMISIDEFTAAWPDMTEAVFVSVDANGDGMIDETELADARAAGILPADES